MCDEHHAFSNLAFTIASVDLGILHGNDS